MSYFLIINEHLQMQYTEHTKSRVFENVRKSIFKSRYLENGYSKQF